MTTKRFIPAPILIRCAEDGYIVEQLGKKRKSTPPKVYQTAREVIGYLSGYLITAEVVNEIDEPFDNPHHGHNDDN